jgi:predicted TIM-barrel fold metal-dependent hydrolase
MIIDGHAHAAGDFCKAFDIIKILNENNVDYVVLAGTPEINSEKNQDLSFFSKFAEKHPEGLIYFTNIIVKKVNSLNRTSKNIELGNEYVYNLVKQYPDRIIQFYWIDPAEKNILTKLDEKYKLYNFKGIKLHQCINKFNLKESYMHEIAQWAGIKGLPIFIHLTSKKDVVNMIQLISQHKNTNFIIGHLIGLEVFIESNVVFPNVFFDISCPQLVPKTKILSCIRKFGAEKVIMGSDTPYGKNNLSSVISNVQNLSLTSHEKDLILGDNMRELLKL